MSCANLLDGAVSVPVSKLSLTSSWTGQDALVNGAVSVPIPYLPASVLVFLSSASDPVVPPPVPPTEGFLSYVISNAGTSTATLDITSSNALDDRVINFTCVSV